MNVSQYFEQFNRLNDNDEIHEYVDENDVVSAFDENGVDFLCFENSIERNQSFDDDSLQSF